VVVMIEVGQVHTVVTVTAVGNGEKVCGMAWVGGWVKKKKKKKRKKKGKNLVYRKQLLFSSASQWDCKVFFDSWKWKKRKNKKKKNKILLPTSISTSLHHPLPLHASSALLSFSFFTYSTHCTSLSSTLALSPLFTFFHVPLHFTPPFISSIFIPPFAFFFHP